MNILLETFEICTRKNIVGKSTDNQKGTVKEYVGEETVITITGVVKGDIITKEDIAILLSNAVIELKQ